MNLGTTFVRARQEDSVGMDEFDYLVIGGGSSGCVVAGRLSEDPATSVALLEAGGMGDSWVITTPAAGVLTVPTKLHNWAFETEPQPGLNGRKGADRRLLPRSGGHGMEWLSGDGTSIGCRP